MKTKLLKKIRKRFIVYKLDGRFVYLDRKDDRMSHEYKTIYSCLCGVVTTMWASEFSDRYINIVLRNQRKRISRITLKKYVPLCEK